MACMALVILKRSHKKEYEKNFFFSSDPFFFILCYYYYCIILLTSEKPYVTLWNIKYANWLHLFIVFGEHDGYISNINHIW